MITPERRPLLASAVLVLVLMLAGAVRFWNLAAHDFGNIYYAAAVRSMSESWSNFFFASFDPAGVVTLDKPPAAFWVQVLSVKLFGYNGFALHLPQAFMGVVNVLLVFLLARRAAGIWAGVIAALVMAVFPAVVAADRSNLPDTFLLLTLLAASLAALRAVETGQWWWLIVAGVLIGVGFTTKMIVAWMIVPAAALTYLVCGPATTCRRTLHICVFGAVTVLTSFAWPAVVDLTPPASRPYMGGTTCNSAVERALGGFGLSRLVGRGMPGGGPPGMGPRAVRPPRPPVRPLDGATGGPAIGLPDGPPGRPMDGPPGGPPGGPSGPGMRGPGGGPGQNLTGFGGMPGVLRFGNRDLAGHGSWLLPLAVVGMVTAARVGAGGRRSVRAASLVHWSAWLITFVVVFSVASGPIHPYYLNTIGPPVAILVGAGITAMVPPARAVQASDGAVTWLSHREMLLAPRLGRAIAAIVLTLVGQVLILSRTGEGGRVLAPAIAILSAASMLVLVVAWWRAARHAAVAGLACGLVALLVCPTIWSWTVAVAGGGRMVPIADPLLLARPRDSEDTERGRAAVRALVDYVQRGAPSASYLVAASDIHLVAPLIIETGARAVATGGFQGNDPAITVERLEDLVAEGALRYVLLSRGRGPAGPPPGNNAVATWVRAHGEVVPTRDWLPRELAAGVTGRPRETSPAVGDWGDMLRMFYRSNATELYDCAPRASD